MSLSDPVRPSRGNAGLWKPWKCCAFPPFPQPLEIPAGFPHSHRSDYGYPLSQTPKTKKGFPDPSIRVFRLILGLENATGRRSIKHFWIWIRGDLQLEKKINFTFEVLSVNLLLMRVFCASIPILLVSLALPSLSSAASSYLLRANSKSQIVQNKRADADDLSRMKDTDMVSRFVHAKLLVPVPSRSKHYYTRFIPSKYCYLRPWSKLFLDRLSSQYHARFKKKLRVTSSVRTVELQKSLARRNDNAASAHGPKRSSHLTGATLDISKKGMKAAEVAWMRNVLHSIKGKGYLYAVEEFGQADLPHDGLQELPAVRRPAQGEERPSV